ncbi:RNA-binding S4 domain-containing protein [Lichenifustis flavocetrariae]|uniref:RNA-binding S4 domain-containing protein n=1 Tax=Lichenifustis flavocetrariae TaxID=2949735 RepID=A0AA41YZ82_9HYPH|nr:RNA-binding S4 domain-containing protein [Lichenifustis flavocetrariae]MCW6507540.1 RNA-binding S4 domain-containing protein [Lichenifustis flavocetrariae]
MSEGSGSTGGDRQRLDKWLWFARVIKSRTSAAKLVEEGHVRVNSVRADNPAKSIRPGDVLTIALDHQIRVLKVVAPGERRGPFEEARHLFDELTQPVGNPVPPL